MRLFIATLFLLSPAAAATTAATGPLLGASISPNGQSVSAPMQIVILMTLLTLLPAVVMSVTPFLRISVVLHFLRQALGTQTTPSNQVLVGLALFLTVLVMQPVATDMYHQGWEPMEQGKMTATQAIDAGAQAASNVPDCDSPAKRTSASSSTSRTPLRRARPRTWK